MGGNLSLKSLEITKVKKEKIDLLFNYQSYSQLQI